MHRSQLTQRSCTSWINTQQRQLFTDDSVKSKSTLHSDAVNSACHQEPYNDNISSQPQPDVRRNLTIVNFISQKKQIYKGKYFSFGLSVCKTSIMKTTFTVTFSV